MDSSAKTERKNVGNIVKNLNRLDFKAGTSLDETYVTTSLKSKRSCLKTKQTCICRLESVNNDIMHSGFK